MSKIMNKISSICSAVFCAPALAPCGALRQLEVVQLLFVSSFSRALCVFVRSSSLPALLAVSRWIRGVVGVLGSASSRLILAVGGRRQTSVRAAAVKTNTLDVAVFSHVCPVNLLCACVAVVMRSRRPFPRIVLLYSVFNTHVMLHIFHQASTSFLM